MRFKDEKTAFETHLAGKVAYIVAHKDQEILDETRTSYSYTVPLNRSAVYSGLLSAAAVVLAFELLKVIFVGLFHLARPHTRRRLAHR